MRFTIDRDHIYMSAENEGETLQIKDAITQLLRFKIAHKSWSDSLYIYTKLQDQYEDELKNK